MSFQAAVGIVLLFVVQPLLWMIPLAIYKVILCYRARRLRRRGDFARAVRLTRRAFRIDRAEMGLSRLADRVLQSRGETFSQIWFPSYVGTVCEHCSSLQLAGELDSAEELLDQTLTLAKTIRAEEGEAYALLQCNRGGTYVTRGAAPEARPLLEQALAIQKKSAPNKPEIGHTLANLGVTYQAMGNYATAAKAYEEAYAVYLRAGKSMRENLIQVLNNLGSLSIEMGDLDRAGRFLREAVDRAQQLHGDRHPSTTTALLNLARWHEKVSDYQESLRLIRRVVEIRRAVLGTEHPAYIHALNNLGASLCDVGAIDEARPIAEEAMAGRIGYGEDHPLATHILGLRARIAIHDGHPREALDLMRESAQIEQRIIGRIFSIASDSERLKYLESIRKRVFYFLSLVYSHLQNDPQAVGAALDLVLTRKALAAEAVAAQRDAVLGGHYPELAGKLKELSIIRQRVAAKMLAGPGAEGLDAYRHQLNQWRKQQSALEVELARAIPEIGLAGRLLTADRRVVAALLPESASLVEFVRFDLFEWLVVPARGDEIWKPARYVAFVLSRNDGPVAMIDLGEAGTIDSLVRAFRGEVLGGPPDGTRGMTVLDDGPQPIGRPTAAEMLRERIFDPLREAISGSAHLILAPDGELATLPFEMLPDCDGRPLVAAHRFSYLAVGRDLLRSKEHPSRADESLVIAGPDFDLGADGPPPALPASSPVSRDLDRSSLRFALLPGTESEGREVASSLGVAPVLGAEAIESRLKSCRSPRILHLATHGFFLADQPGDPDVGRGQGVRLRGAPENPLLRSGLALAGANTWLSGGTPPSDAEDGLLTAEDVTGLDLINTELVVLSACETGLGEVKAGEGVFGLRRAFQLAGARTVVMSLWKVPDEATRELMSEFYRNLLSGMPRAEALRQAQLTLRQRYPDPRYWGAFILQGESGPLSPGRTNATPERSSSSPIAEWIDPTTPATKKAPSEVVYDILEDRMIRQDDIVMIFLALPFLAAFFLFLVTGLQDRKSLTKQFVIVFVGFRWVIDQRRCRAWYRAGNYVTIEGVVSDLRLQTANSSWDNASTDITFHLGDQDFILETNPRHGGFRLSNIKWVGDISAFIWNGSRLRITHHDGRILRIDSLNPEALPSPAPQAEALPSSAPQSPAPALAEPRPCPIPVVANLTVHEPGVVYIRIVTPPPWPVPPDICRAWVGMELPVLGTGPTSPPKQERIVPRPKYGGLLRGIFERLTEGTGINSSRPRAEHRSALQTNPPTEYEVDAPRALDLLAGTAPWAAKWWRESAPDWHEHGSTLVFPADVCEVVGETQVDSLPTPPRTAVLTGDPTFDPPRDRLPEASVPGFLDDVPAPPPVVTSPRRRFLTRLGLFVLAAVLLAAVIDLCFGEGRKGFGPWVFISVAWLGGAAFAHFLPRINKALNPKEAHEGIGNNPNENRKNLGWFLCALLFTTAGIWIVHAYSVDLPETAHRVTKRRFEAQRPLQYSLAPCFAFFGGLGFGVGAASLCKLSRQQ